MMNDLAIPGFQHAIKAIHGAHSLFERRVRVLEESDGEALWEGDVLVFKLLDHPRSPRCYAWEEDGQVTAILHDELVRSPQDAVRAAVRVDGDTEE
jgi:hypothetical protein